MQCGLCSSPKIEEFFFDEKRSWPYFICRQCDLVFRDPQTYLDAETEKARYQTHNNSIENVGYVRFLGPVVELLLPYLKAGDQGLDFGSGPGPIIDQLFRLHGFEVSNYDPYFTQSKQNLEKAYEFVTCTEVFEHLYKPQKEMDLIAKVLKSRGFLVLMSEFWRDLKHFPHWGYRMDNTHVCFLNKNSLQWLADHWNYDILSCDGRISLLKKKF